MAQRMPLRQPGALLRTSRIERPLSLLPPQLKDYVEVLQAFNVPFYKPTAAEIGCTQEELDKSCDHFAYNPRMKDPPDPRFPPDWLRPNVSAQR